MCGAVLPRRCLGAGAQCGLFVLFVRPGALRPLADPEELDQQALELKAAEAIALNAREISDLGRELYERIRTLAEHFDKVGDHLGKSVAAYNRAVGSLENRVLPQARRFQSLGVGSTKEMTELVPLEIAPLTLSAAELRLPLAAGGEA